ncbi:MAG TPA: hypothetical protein PLR28_01615 [Dokdonella sp.]|uniref:hypothetical protein n=1 Tax=Dokdonella sp. TaxID=2291710 RepID=UPI002B55B1C4|nr:hypothetical protein [Dokdonella sp.]HOX72764.1 hypothetical protein [Dokdonella sp.]HPG93234.1 hypothetical protein [Dokdonella sp.]HPN78853.1 hypothetical protein [Dokdonella sp.]
MKIAIRNAVIIALLAGASVASQARGPNAYEALATLPDTTAAQQADILRIENERRSAYADLFEKRRAERDRIDEQTAQKLRKALGDEGYRKYVEWKMAHAGPHGRMHARGKHGPRQPGMRGGPGMSGGPELAPIDPNDDDDGDDEPNA